MQCSTITINKVNKTSTCKQFSVMMMMMMMMIIIIIIIIIMAINAESYAVSGKGHIV